MGVAKQYAITGISQSDKFLVKKICEAEGISQREWVRRHLEIDHSILKDREEGERRDEAEQAGRIHKHF